MKRIMQAITICQPYAHLIVTPLLELPPGFVQKRVENRTWKSSYRGALLIHAGKSEKFLGPTDVDQLQGMEFGAIVGQCRMIDCVQRTHDASRGLVFEDETLRRYPWIEHHEHAEGPYCFVLADVMRFWTPIPWAGKQGFFHVPDAVVSGAKFS
jgi:hypothetical protein